MAVSHWCEVFKSQGHSNLNICTPGSKLAHHLKTQGFEVLEWKSRKYVSPGFSLQLRRLLNSYEIHSVFIHNLRDLWLVSPALMGKSEIQLVGFCQMLLDVNKKDFLHSLIYKRLDQLCVLTDWQKEALKPYLPVPDKVYKKVPNFVDCQRFHPHHRSESFRREMGLSKNHFAIGIIGRLDVQKGQKELIEAFVEVSRKYDHWRLILVGEPTPNDPKQEQYAHQLRKRVKELKMESKILFYGFRQDTHKFMANFDLFVLASYKETFGFVVIEAMASGTPVLATRAGGVPEILDQGQCGYLCEAQNSKSLAQKIEEVWLHPEERKQRVQKALEKVRSIYEKKQIYEKLMEVIFPSQ